jgi:epoxyqueuosine reductase
MLQVTQTQYEEIKALASRLGFPEMGAAEAQPVLRAKEIRTWIQNGYHAGMDWFTATVEKRINPKTAFPEAKSVLALLSPYQHEPTRLGEWKLARFACGDDYHDILKKKLKQLCRHIQAEIPGSDFRVYVDSGPISERYWAEQCGLGWIGKNGNVIHKKNGSYFFISCILTNLLFPFSTPHTSHCGSCRACLDQCPTGAIVRPGIVDSNRCISYLTIEHRGAFEESHELNNWIFGCDICQEACPWNRKTPNWTMLEAFQPRKPYNNLSTSELKNMEDSEFRVLFRKSPLKRTRLEGIKRNLNHL